ncbi:VOC family protein [Sinomonas sp. ASV322]|uniref:VOC family protein n=1 Tax=Sinomonas sp. ASV322 TaxID=3041920 RepID=UPI0027DADD31|nr:VOC family protein [Sinomonas sp. ASV322]MDQ4503902.1 VOC family protein [Sinomonas sp. ASV322]
MPKPEITPGAPCWADLMTSDIEKAKAFYAELFGWTYEVGDEEKYGGYTTAWKDGEQVAGLMTKMPEQATMPDVWTLYFNSADINETARKVEEAGGQTFVAPMEVPDQGHMAVFADTDGAVFGVWQGTGHAGFEKVAEPGSPVWFENFTRAYDPTVKFYQDALGWETSVMGDSPEFRYTTLGSGDESKAGIMDAVDFLPEGVPANWHIYWGVTDADAAIETATRLGAQVIRPIEDTPFGRMATVADPFGAVFLINEGFRQD